MWWWLAACPKTAPVSPSPTPGAPGTEDPSGPSRVGSAEARAFYLRAVAARERGQEIEAVRAAEWVLRLSPRDVWAQLRVAELYLELSDATRAIEPARSAVALAEARPEALARAHRALGLALLALGDLGQALPLLEQAQGLAGVDTALISAYRQLGQHDRAEQQLSRWVPVAPAERLERARLDLQHGTSVAMELLEDPALGPRALEVLLELRGSRATDASRCDLSALHRWVVEHAAKVEQPVFSASLFEVAWQTGDEALLARLSSMSARPAPEPPALDPSLEALARAGQLEDALIAAAQTARDDVDMWVGRARVYQLAGQVEPERAALQEALVLAPCRPEVLVRTSELTGDACLLERAASVRAADPTLRARSQALSPCEEVD